MPFSSQMTDPVLQRLVTRLRFRHLQMLLALQNAGTLHGAARLLHLSQPALSKAIGEVEQAFGYPLFTRSARGLHPTSAGQVVLKAAGVLLHTLIHTHADGSTGAYAAPCLRLGCTPFLAQHYLPHILKRLGLANTPLRITITEERAPLLLDALGAGTLDAAITTYESRNERLDAFCYTTLFKIGLTVVTAFDNSPPTSARTDWAALATRPWILPHASSTIRHEVEACFRSCGVTPPVPTIESANPITNIRLAAAGLGLSVVPAISARQAMRTEHIQRIRTVPALPRQSVALIRRPGPSSPAFERLAQVFQI